MDKNYLFIKYSLIVCPIQQFQHISFPYAYNPKIGGH